MQLIVLGSGTSVPHPSRSSSAYWLESGGSNVLLDCSASAVLRMCEEGLDWSGLDSIWISHFHLDHVGGLAPFLAGTRHSPQMKSRTRPLKIFGGAGLKELLRKFDEANNYKLFDQPFPLNVIEIEPLEKFMLAPGLDAVAMSTPHTEESHALHVRDSAGTTLVYTADTGFTDVISAFARKVDLLVIEASFPANKPAEKHLELAEAMYIVRKAEPRRAVLTHLYPDWDGIDLVAEAAKYSPPCEIIEAKDGLRLELS